MLSGTYNVLAGSQVVAQTIGPATIFSFTSDRASSHLLMHNGESVLIDCHDPAIRGAIEALDQEAKKAGKRVVMPTRILHTHVQPEHCREGDAFGAAKIIVPAGLEEVAQDTPAYRRDSSKKWEHPELWGETMGRETYGVGGSVVLRPPTPALRVAQTITAGETISVGGLALRAIALPGHGWHALGYLLLESQSASAKAIAFFSADLFRDPAVLVNVYDLEVAYGRSFLWKLPPLLESVDQLVGDLPYFPATGPVIANGRAQSQALQAKIKAYFKACEWPEGSWTKPAGREFPLLGKYKKHAEGIYQLTTGGNTILFIDRAGNGLMIDPGPCDFEHPEQRYNDFRNDLAMFEKEAGLKAIDLAIITHFHGDHYDMTPLLRERYPACIIAAWDPVARVLEDPDKFPYACKLPWYDIGLGAMKIDLKLTRKQPHRWHDTLIETIHLPGHCNAHGGHLFTFNGQKIAITGDTIQTYGWPEGLGFVTSNDSTPDTDDGCLLAYKNMAKHAVDLNLGGHSSWFVNPTPVYAESVRRMEHALPALRALVPNGDMPRAFRRPWFPDLGLDRV